MECPAFGSCSGKPETCWDGMDQTSYCWKITWALLSVGIVLIAYGDFCLVRVGVFERLVHYMGGVKQPDQETPEEDTNEGAFKTSLRTEANFIKDFDDPTTVKPNKAKKPEYDLAHFSAEEFLFTVPALLKSPKYVFYARYIHSIVLSSVGWGCVCSAASTSFWLIMAWESFCVTEGYTSDKPNTMYIEETGTALRTLLSSYAFLPSFFLIQGTRLVVSQWLAWLGAIKGMRYALNHTALICGSALRDPTDTNARKKLFQMYRYMLLVHMAGIRPYFRPSLKDHLWSGTELCNSGILIETEVPAWDAAGDAKGDLCFSWLAATIIDYSQLDSVVCDPTTLHARILTMLGTWAPSTRSPRRLTPNIFIRAMFLLSTFFFLLVVVSFPFSLLVYVDYPYHLEGGGSSSSGRSPLMLLGTPCFQPVVLFGVSLFVAAIRVLLMTIYILRDPFTWEGERIRPDTMLVRSEGECFNAFRVQFVTKTTTLVVKQQQQQQQEEEAA